MTRLRMLFRLSARPVDEDYAALIDRLVRHAHMVTIKGKSYRL